MHFFTLQVGYLSGHDQLHQLSIMDNPCVLLTGNLPYPLLTSLDFELRSKRQFIMQIAVHVYLELILLPQFSGQRELMQTISCY